MPSQPVPNVSDDDVNRIAIRDFGADKLQHVLSIVGQFGKQTWNQPSPRVWLAILKLANGDLERLTEEKKLRLMTIATSWPQLNTRDILARSDFQAFLKNTSVQLSMRTGRNTERGLKGK